MASILNMLVYCSTNWHDTWQSPDLHWLEVVLTYFKASCCLCASKDILLGSRLLYNPIKVHTRRLNKARWQSFALVLARVQYRLVGCIYTPNLCYIMTIMPLRARDIRRIFRAVGHFIQVGMYKLPTLSDSWSGRYPKGTVVTFGSAVDLR